jgi:predicted DNA-binding protein (MmcQ/YjbR family)
MGMKPRRKPAVTTARDALRAYAFSLPEAYEDHPWGESVAKVRKKVFVFFGVSAEWGFSVKLPESGEAILSFPFASPTGYGLGKSGWVSIEWSPDLPLELLQTWVLESYRAVAPKKLVAALETS